MEPCLRDAPWQADHPKPPMIPVGKFPTLLGSSQERIGKTGFSVVTPPCSKFDTVSEADSFDSSLLSGDSEDYSFKKDEQAAVDDHSKRASSVQLPCVLKASPSLLLQRRRSSFSAIALEVLTPKVAWIKAQPPNPKLVIARAGSTWDVLEEAAKDVKMKDRTRRRSVGDMSFSGAGFDEESISRQTYSPISAANPPRFHHRRDAILAEHEHKRYSSEGHAFPNI
eukprot:CAMPEP_0169105162 /NCGR_PEP_ID=MMETSP1015-20121227/23642_1 /TAXON_ID=342587 /ORGANISM="Karlodinium micrum, Strain CCMP2283" /LENGTH=224 /DNA_ID=CAMNT_0009166489 /DNA_START=163 /DNA_END=837 /DNA_ORIENTATION=+